MAKYTMNFQGVPRRIYGTVHFSPDSSLNGKPYAKMTTEEQQAFRQIFLDHGADDALCDTKGKYIYNYHIEQ